MESLIFDVDGTLWDAVALVAEGWNDGLQSMGFAPHCTEQSIRPLFGKTMTEIAQVVVPGVPQEQAMEVMDRCMDGEMARLRRDPCHIFYPGVKETLTELHKTNRLFIVSFNLMLIILGVTGVIQPTLSALLHNMSTLGISLRSMTNLLPENTEQNNA